jgi:hypothetical protein
MQPPNRAGASFVGSLQEAFKPVVLVLCSAEVDKLCRRSHLSFVELLRPLGLELSGVGSVSFRTASKSYNLKNFGVRFVSPVEVQAIDSKLADRHLENVVRGCAPAATRMEDNVRDTLDVHGFWRTTPEVSGWYTRYRNEFVETLRFSEFDFIDQPIACLYAVSASEESPLGTMESLRQNRHLPALLQNGFYDRDLHKMYAVVHDNHSTNPNAIDQ